MRMNNNYNYNRKSGKGVLRRLFAMRTGKKGLVLRLPEVVRVGDSNDTLQSQVLVSHRSTASVWGRVFYHGAKIAAFALLVLSVISGLANIKRLTEDKANKQIVLQSESSQFFPPIHIHEDDLDEYLVNGKVIEVIKQPKDDEYYYEPIGKML